VTLQSYFLRKIKNTMNITQIKDEALADWKLMISGNTPTILVGNATCGRSAGSEDVIQELLKFKKENNLNFDVKETGCIGMCYQEPIVGILSGNKPMVLYGNVNTDFISTLIDSFFVKKKPLIKNVIGYYSDFKDEIDSAFGLPVIKTQVKNILQNCGTIDPTDINHYIANKGYTGIEKALSASPAEVLSNIKDSGLRGRGGAGFPTWKKWDFCIQANGDQKYVVCNADEGDPGAFMNRSLMEGDPHSLIEGMIIAGYTIGAELGYIYCRAEYPLALERLRTAIDQATEKNLLGDNILQSKFSFHLKIKEGAGAFVCGEETALIASIEGKRGMPKLRPPFPAVKGLWGKPTIINNVETLASVARIMQYGPERFNQYGTEKSKGTKTFALVGKIKHAGLIEVPLGTSLREIIFDIGGGIPNGKKFKAVQTGGPSGGCVPEHLLDVAVDYESLGEIGTIMGSGGLVVMDESTCMVDVARYFLDFAQKESCGECAPCRLGTKQMLDILNDITQGRGRMEDIDLLVGLGEGIKKASLCGLGQTAPNPVLTTIKYFRNEYEDHILHHKCTSGVCKELIHFKIKEDKCTGCHICSKSCPVDSITGKPKEIHSISQESCIKCGLCYEKCPKKFSAVELTPGKI
jgi:NADH-quinone oxidoreductase subunit F